MMAGQPIFKLAAGIFPAAMANASAVWLSPWRAVAACARTRALQTTDAPTQLCPSSGSYRCMSGSTKALAQHIQTKIMMRGGPISLAEYMQDCLTSPLGGFYMNNDVFGRGGHFTTSPEISQLFGEMVGIWCVHAWMALGQPPLLRLVELGPGRGTLMSDLLRGTAVFKQFASSLEVHMVEVSPALRAMQWTALRCSPTPDALDLAAITLPDNIIRPGGGSSSNGGNSIDGAPSASSGGVSGGKQKQKQQPVQEGVCGFNGRRVTWHTTLDSVPEGIASASASAASFSGLAVKPTLTPSSPAGNGSGSGSGDAAAVPTLLIAHEFFDALPVHQFVRDGSRGWLEKLVDVDQPEATEAVAEGEQAQPQPQQAQRSPDTSATAARNGTESGSASDGSGGGGGARVASGDGSGSGSSSSGGEAESSVRGSGLRMVLSPGPTPASALLAPRRLAGLPKEQADSITGLEVCAQGMALAERLAQRLARGGGAALVVDYGRDAPPYADSLMGIRDHQGVGVLDGPGSADLSAWVDFGSLRQAVEGAGVPVTSTGPVSQASFLRGLGIEARLQALTKRASPDQARSLAEGVERLLKEDATGMGRTYQVMAIHSKQLEGQLAGFEEASK